MHTFFCVCEHFFPAFQCEGAYFGQVLLNFLYTHMRRDEDDEEEEVVG